MLPGTPFTGMSRNFSFGVLTSTALDDLIAQRLVRGPRQAKVNLRVAGESHEHLIVELEQISLEFAVRLQVHGGSQESVTVGQEDDEVHLLGKLQRPGQVHQLEKRKRHFKTPVGIE